MHTFASFILKGRSQAILVTTVAAALSLVLPILSHVSGGTLGLVTLRHGYKEGIIVFAASSAILVAVAILASLEQGFMLFFLLATTLGLWLPVIIGAHVLRTTRSLGLVLAVSGALGVVALTIMYLVFGDVTAMWQSILEKIAIPVLQQTQLPLTSDEVAALIAGLSEIMSGIIATTMIYSVMINIFIARWLQAILFNPGGFRVEFQEIKLGRTMGIMAMAALGLTIMTGNLLGNYFLNLMLIVVAMYSLHGLSLTHALVNATKIHHGWLIGIYILMLFFLLQVMVVLSALGFADSWADFRARILSKGQRPGKDLQ